MRLQVTFISVSLNALITHKILLSCVGYLVCFQVVCLSKRLVALSTFKRHPSCVGHLMCSPVTSESPVAMSADKRLLPCVRPHICLFRLYACENVLLHLKQEESLSPEWINRCLLRLDDLTKYFPQWGHPKLLSFVCDNSLLASVPELVMKVSSMSAGSSGYTA